MSYVKVEQELHEPALFIAKLFESLPGQISITANYVLVPDALGVIGPISPHISLVEDLEAGVGIARLSYIKEQKDICSNFFKEGYEDGYFKNIFYFLAQGSFGDPEIDSQLLPNILFQYRDRKLVMSSRKLSEQRLFQYLEEYGLTAFLNEPTSEE